MDSTTHQNFELQNQQPSSGLLRFRSAPSSFLSNFSGSLDSGVNKVSLDSERLISRFANSSGGGGDIHDKSRVTAAEAVAVTYANSQQSYSGLPPHYPRHGSVTSFSSAMDGRYEFLAAGHQTQGKSVSSSLMRQTSSPPGLFANISVQDGYATMKGVGNYGGVSGSNGDISEIESESIETRVPDDDNKLRTSSGDGRFYGTDFLYGSWNDSSNFTENFCGMKREQDDRKLFSGIQNGDLGGRVQLLSHHLSLPKSSAEMVAMEKYLHFQDSVPCKIRAKRGCATHPRSIAERIRRTRISERMRKLQELVPNMDKQTNTADMLDLAVDYIKDLQKQFKTLSDIRANCKCINIQKPVSNQIV
ncbi:hypothetical protein SLE2022_137780 [Rubroshorea leprosula]